MRILVADTGSAALLASSAISAAHPTIIAVVATTSEEADRLGRHFGYENVTQYWDGGGPGKALLWRQESQIESIGREQLYSVEDDSHLVARGALSVRLRWLSETTTIMCARYGEDVVMGDLRDDELAKIAAGITPPAVLIVRGSPPSDVLPTFRLATKGTSTQHIILSEAHDLKNAGRAIFGLQPSNGSRASWTQVSRALDNPIKVYTSQGCTIAQSGYIVTPSNLGSVAYYDVAFCAECNGAAPDSDGDSRAAQASSASAISSRTQLSHSGRI